ncbi:MAG: tRNA dihydrouridine(20/20a) synthase DusA [Alphaproteobacteria bacterium]|nr:MAG: tRNA dihydrouridine(20/20a) synthase DusA [Alphaproteobacteria bacterium]
MTDLNRTFSVAPMMDWTDRHDRFFLRQISARTLLYTEMVTTGAVLHGDREYLLSYNREEHPIALQLGGSDPTDLAEATRIAEDFGYDEVNLNVGCPSDRVQSGRFGACLMAEPELVADCIGAMQAATRLPVTVKSRIGIDAQEPREVLPGFIERVADAGCKTFIIHARKAWLEGLSPKENRDVPPLDYQIVYDMKQARPDLEIIINGGIDTLDEVDTHLAHVDGVMLGRVAYHNPWILAAVDARYFGDTPNTLTRADIVEAMLPYVEAHLARGGALHHVTRHMVGLFQGCPGARAWRRHLSEEAVKPGAGAEVLTDALALVPEEFSSERVA